MMMMMIMILLAKTAKSRLCQPLENLGATYTVHLWLVGKRVVDFLLVPFELFSTALAVEAPRYERILVHIVHFKRKLQVEWVIHQRHLVSEN